MQEVGGKEKMDGRMVQDLPPHSPENKIILLFPAHHNPQEALFAGGVGPTDVGPDAPGSSLTRSGIAFAGGCMWFPPPRVLTVGPIYTIRVSKD